MRIITLFSAVILSCVVLVGCSTIPASAPHVGRAPPAQTIFNTLSGCSPNCTVKVNVVGDCEFDVPDFVIIGGALGSKHGVAWVIQFPDYVFATPASTALDPKDSGNFFGPPVAIGPFMAVQVTIATPGLIHEYGLKIVKRDGTACKEYDPFMVE